MAQTKDNERPRIGDASRRKLLPFGWTLFTAVWLSFSAGFVAQVLRTGLAPLQTLAFLSSMAAFVAVFVWLMLRYPFPAGALRDLRVRLFLLLVLVALALYVELVYGLVYGGGVPYRFMYVVVAAAVILPTRHAAWAVTAVTVFAGVFYEVRSGWDAVAADWGNLIPFALIGVGMMVVSRLVVTVRELDAARKEISRLAVAEERLRFARDLHDLLGHSLSSIALKSELAGRLLPVAPEKAASEVHDIEGVARRALREVREAVAGYRRTTLSEELDGAREMLAAAGIACRIENDTGVLPGATDTVLAWTVREGVTNVIRHSHAGKCRIRLTRDGERVRAEVTDDGRGLSGGRDETGSGLVGLSERVSASGGDFEAGPLPEGGFRLRVGITPQSGESPTVEPPALRADGAHEDTPR